MNLPRHQLLAGATLSTDQHRRRSGPHLPDERENLLHRRRGSYQVSEYATKTQFALQLVGFLQASFVVNRTLQKYLEGARFHRFLQEPECLKVMDGGKRLFHAAESGERDRRREVDRKSTRLN